MVAKHSYSRNVSGPKGRGIHDMPLQVMSSQGGWVNIRRVKGG
jgi:hypothetical protein